MFALVLALAVQQPVGLQASPVARIVVTPAEVTVMAGDSIRLRGEALDSLGRAVPNATVRFFVGGGMGESMEAHVEPDGLLRAGSRGTMLVRAIATIPGARASRPQDVPVRVLPPPASRVSVRPALTRLLVGQRLTVAGEVFAANGDRRDDPVSWTSSAPAILRVEPDGRLEARAVGAANLTATAGGASAVVRVVVAPNTVRRIEISGGGAEARTGDVLRFRAMARDAAGREVAVQPEWSFGPGNGQIDADGAFVAYLPGDYTITASVGAAEAWTRVHVTYRDVRRAATIVGRRPVVGRATTEFWPHPNGRNGYLGTMSDRIYALDISNPANIVVTDSVMADMQLSNDVMTTADGRWAVFTREGASSRRNGIGILDLADPAHPRLVAEYTETVSGGVHSAYVYTQPTFGTHVYLTDDATGSMRVIDLNDPLHPREIARWQTSDKQGRYLHDVDVRDGLAYLSYWNDGLVVLDVGNGMRGGTPASPQLVTQFRYDLSALYHDVEVEGGPGYIRGTHTAMRRGNYVFVGDEVFSARPQGVQMPGMPFGKANGRLHVIDISDLANPREVAWYESRDGGSHNIWIAGDTLYMGDYQGGLKVIDISGELRGDLQAQGREIAKVHTGDRQGFVPNAAMTWGAFHANGLVWANDIFSGLWAIRLEPRDDRRPAVP